MENFESAVAQGQKLAADCLEEIEKDRQAIEAAAADYDNSAVSFSASVGPSGCNLKGWITYTQTGKKIHFEMKECTSTWGAGGGAGAAVLVGALSQSRLGGGTGRFRFSGGAVGGVLQMWHHGTPVFTINLPIAGGGVFWGWGAEGSVKFTAHDS